MQRAIESKASRVQSTAEHTDHFHTIFSINLALLQQLKDLGLISYKRVETSCNGGTAHVQQAHLRESEFRNPCKQKPIQLTSGQRLLYSIKQDACTIAPDIPRS